MDEREARLILRQHRYERSIDDPGSCVEIVKRRNLAPLLRDINVIPVNTNVDYGSQVYNMTANVGDDPSPYFADVRPIKL